MRPPPLPRRALCTLLLLVALWAAGCGRTEDTLPPGQWTPEERVLLRSLTPIPAPPPSPGNRFADDPDAAALGQALFYDQRLSSNGQVACANCHQPQRYFADGLPLAKGVGTTGRHAPTVLGAAHLPFVFWDGRKDSLWSQSHGPLESEVEHDIARTDVVRVVYRHHRAAYEALFGGLPDLGDEARFPLRARPVDGLPNEPASMAWASMTAEDRAAIDLAFANIGKAIEAYERRLQPQPAPFDRYVAALESGDASGGGHLDDAALRGLRAFIGIGGCVNCHNGPLLTDKGFHNLGLPRNPQQSGLDVGRTLGAKLVKEDPFSCGGSYSDSRQCDELRFLNPRFEDFLGAFKTPTLRNVAETAPYMHDGRLATLEAVVTFYKERPGKAEIGHRDLVLDQIDPSRVATADLVAFLRSLTGPLPAAELLGPPSAAGGAR
ncbi:MAG: hypothetical protein RIT45_2392 [Pseudomonadota bacterium]|jgi:cytochrome c peroxidase